MIKKCNNCGNPTGMPFICFHCGKSFCVECKLPETHNCDNFNSIMAIPLWKKLNN